MDKYPDEEKLLRQCKMREIFWLATVSRPDVRARPAPLAPKVNVFQGDDVYPMNALIKTMQLAQPRAVLRRTSSSFPLLPAGSDTRGRRRTRGGKMRGGALSLVGWPDASFGISRRAVSVGWDT